MPLNGSLDIASKKLKPRSDSDLAHKLFVIFQIFFIQQLNIRSRSSRFVILRRDHA